MEVNMKNFLFVILLFSLSANAARLHTEAYYQDIWCLDHDGETSVKMPIGTFADCITTSHAIEFDFADKWAEAIGQALHYAQQTNKRAGIVLILEESDDERFWDRLRVTIQNTQLPIDVWFIGDGVGEDVGSLSFYSQESASYPMSSLSYNGAWVVKVPYIRDDTGIIGDLWADFKIMLNSDGIRTELSNFGMIE